MGAWGTGPFENDDAADFISTLSSRGFDAINDALNAATDGREVLESPDASYALAAAEIVAALKNQPLPSLPEEVTAWLPIGRRVRLAPGLFEKAHRAVQRVRDSSEAKELWEESDSAAAWRAAVDDLLTRLA